MDTRKLMIGDFVYCEPEGKEVQVREVRETLVKINRFTLIAFEDEIQPIPLTDEILDANFGHNDLTAAARWIIRKPGQLYLEIYHWKGDAHYEVFNGLEIRYVHELQHAMRLCGGYELADNLNIG